MGPLLFFLLLPLTYGYHLFEYSGNECNGAPVLNYRLAGPSACQKLSYGTAESVLVKIDNVHDELYDVAFYDEEDCGGEVVSVIHNTNGCIDLYAMPGYTARSVRVQKHVTGKRDRRSQADPLLNYQIGGRDQPVTPIRKGVFVSYNSSNIDSEGTFQDDIIHEFYPFTQEEADEVAAIRTTEYQLESNFTVTKYTSPALDTRNFVLAKCFEHPLCASHALNIAIKTNQLALAMGRVLSNTPWTAYRNEAFLNLGAVSSAWTIYSAFSTSGTQDMSCDTEKTTGALVRDILLRESSHTQDLTNALFTICGNNHTCFRAAMRLYLDNDPETNQDGCGACTTCV
ncbi:hypothetical protein BDV38DRAFT_279990 [Aspergillus pseudotamarii]|uniref:Uncharacterized protein n=1 Tax=Aspergillus pseudotamarii TaxID=132259 RepID=A0A5N6T2I6_ASPPS|nr:uncharacterized protein BDV38DRAFT_279990 [Aspergillus pseudotamarii]KAE8140489.1 hypothetical protein BDV38DRAFT_279990 [Aspergillus pseudotamarii]